MARKPNPNPDDPAQSQRFIEAAKQAEADETRSGADRAFKRVDLSRQRPETKDRQ